MDPRWADFDLFLADMGRKPSPDLTLDRADGDGPYDKNNCRWATREVQSRNRKYATVRAWEVAAELGLSAKTVYHMMWEVRRKDRGELGGFSLSAENEARIRKFMEPAPCSA